MQKIVVAQKVDIYGIGITYTIAAATAFKFSTLGIDCSVHNGLNEHYVIAGTRKSHRIALLFSMTGGNQTIARAAEYLKKAGVYTVGIGSSYYPALRQHCLEYISLPRDLDLLGLEIMAPIISYNYVIDILFTALLVRDYRKHVEIAAQVKNITVSELDHLSHNKTSI